MATRWVPAPDSSSHSSRAASGGGPNRIPSSGRNSALMVTSEPAATTWSPGFTEITTRATRSMSAQGMRNRRASTPNGSGRSRGGPATIATAPKPIARRRTARDHETLRAGWSVRHDRAACSASAAIRSGEPCGAPVPRSATAPVRSSPSSGFPRSAAAARSNAPNRRTSGRSPVRIQDQGAGEQPCGPHRPPRRPREVPGEIGRHPHRGGNGQDRARSSPNRAATTTGAVARPAGRGGARSDEANPASSLGPGSSLHSSDLSSGRADRTSTCAHEGDRPSAYARTHATATPRQSRTRRIAAMAEESEIPSRVECSPECLIESRFYSNPRRRIVLD